MKSIKSVLDKFNPTEDKYVSREFQSFGVHLAQKLDDERRKALYIKLAKELPRPALEKALQFVIDSNARKKGALFMWKLKDMGILGNKDAKSGNKDSKKGSKSGKKASKKTSGAAKKSSSKKFKKSAQSRK